VRSRLSVPPVPSPFPPRRPRRSWERPLTPADRTEAKGQAACVERQPSHRKSKHCCHLARSASGGASKHTWQEFGSKEGDAFRRISLGSVAIGIQLRQSKRITRNRAAAEARRSRRQRPASESQSTHWVVGLTPTRMEQARLPQLDPRYLKCREAKHFQDTVDNMEIPEADFLVWYKQELRSIASLTPGQSGHRDVRRDASGRTVLAARLRADPD